MNVDKTSAIYDASAVGGRTIESPIARFFGRVWLALSFALIGWIIFGLHGLTA